MPFSFPPKLIHSSTRPPSIPPSALVIPRQTLDSPSHTHMPPCHTLSAVSEKASFPQTDVSMTSPMIIAQSCPLLDILMGCCVKIQRYAVSGSSSSEGRDSA